MSEKDQVTMSDKVEKLLNETPEFSLEHSLEDQLAVLAEISQGFASSLNIEETLKNAIEKIMIYMGAEAASIFLLENKGRDLVCRDFAGPVNILNLRLDATQGIVGKSVATKTCQIVRDVSKDPAFAKSVDENTGFVTRSILCAPLLIQGKCIGALELVNKKSGIGLFDDHDKNLLMALASAAALSIHNATMAKALVEQERMRRELELAREIQMDLLPGLEDDSAFPVRGMNVPAMEVSGDFYDFFRLDDGRIYFNLADVSGKGMNAAMLMAKASSLLHHLAKSVRDPGELLARVNNELCETVSHGMFITIVSGFIDMDNREIVLSNAGHQPPLYHYHDGSFEEIPAQAPPLGILPFLDFPATTIPMTGGSLYLFTDGVTESLGPDDKPLDVEGLIRIIESNPRLAASKRLESIIAEIRKPDINQRDDITLMVIDCVAQ